MAGGEMVLREPTTGEGARDASALTSALTLSGFTSVEAVAEGVRLHRVHTQFCFAHRLLKPFTHTFASSSFLIFFLLLFFFSHNFISKPKLHLTSFYSWIHHTLSTHPYVFCCFTGFYLGCCSCYGDACGILSRVSF